MSSYTRKPAYTTGTGSGDSIETIGDVDQSTDIIELLADPRKRAKYLIDKQQKEEAAEIGRSEWHAQLARAMEVFCKVESCDCRVPREWIMDESGKPLPEVPPELSIEFEKEFGQEIENQNQSLLLAKTHLWVEHKNSALVQRLMKRHKDKENHENTVFWFLRKSQAFVEARQDMLSKLERIRAAEEANPELAEIRKKVEGEQNKRVSSIAKHYLTLGKE